MRTRPLSASLLKAAPLAAAMLLLPGCLSLGAKVPPTLYTLTASAQVPAGATFSGNPRTAIMVMEPDTDQRLAAVRVPVQVDDTNVAYLKGAAWVERPSRLFRALLAETLRAKTSTLVVEDSQAEISIGTRLSGRLIDMGYDARSSSVVVRFEAVRSGAGGTVTTKRFESVVPGVLAKPELVGPALNQAANAVAGQVADWAGG